MVANRKLEKILLLERISVKILKQDLSGLSGFSR